MKTKLRWLVEVQDKDTCEVLRTWVFPTPESAEEAIWDCLAYHDLGPLTELVTYRIREDK